MARERGICAVAPRALVRVVVRGAALETLAPEVVKKTEAIHSLCIADRLCPHPSHRARKVNGHVLNAVNVPILGRSQRRPHEACAPRVAEIRARPSLGGHDGVVELHLEGALLASEASSQTFNFRIMKNILIHIFHKRCSMPNSLPL